MKQPDKTPHRTPARPAQFTAATPPAQPALVVQPSDSRTSLTFYPSVIGTVTWNTRPPAANGDGFTMPQSGTPITLTVETHGAIVRQGWFAFSNPNFTPAVWSECMD